MMFIFNEKHENLYDNYKFEKITHEDALHIYSIIIELQLCKDCNSIREIQNIKTKCTQILNILDMYKDKEK